MFTKRFIYLLFFFLALTKVNAQDENPFIAYDVPAQNLLKFNRFLLNPTFSTVQEDKSYVNLFHRNQSVSFDDNNQTYFLSYSGRIGDRSGLGLSLYRQTEGIISNFGVLANYAYGIKLSDKSNFTFGANLSYYQSGFDEGRSNPVTDDPLLSGFQDSALLSFQPGFNISYGNFDFGVFAENLFDYNIKSSESITEFNEKTFSTHLQYTHKLKNTTGILEQARVMPLARVRKVGQQDLVLGGSLILDLPKIGWVQGGYDSFYGASGGLGFNINRRLSVGYSIEKGLSNNFDNFGLTHEINFAYSFTPNLTEDRVMLEDDFEDSLVENTPKEEVKSDVLSSSDEEIQRLKEALAENDAILAELMFRQDSLESSRQKDLERRFEMVMRMVRSETKGNRPDLEKKAKQLYYVNNEKGNLPAELIAPTDTTAETAVATTAEENDYDKNMIAAKEHTTEKPSGIENQKSVLKEEDNTAIAANKIDKKPASKIAPKPEKENKAFALKEQKTDAIASTSTKKKVFGNTPTDEENTAFTRAAKRQKVKNKKFKNLAGVADGYYIVANVYKGNHYLNKFVNKLKDQGLEADYIDNTNNGLKYVYLERYDTWQDALAAHKSKINGAYTDQMWIMNVDNTDQYTDKAYVANTKKIKEKAAKYDTDVLQKNVVVKDKVASNQTKSKTYNINGVGSGFYIIANVFSSQRNANRFVKLLNSQGLNASYFINPENNFRYVYLKKHASWNNALISYYSKLNSTYDKKMWIMRVSPNQIT
ncbi:PorP/SprF family type IX secretion system membrane protein [Spongiimicrobium salis]|uniref:PorP/SprF family type IX secretion system membrane protein n=1 Tax=Spongiimicrobium salis TaxID=1667022 RepID=UPI00374D02C0